MKFLNVYIAILSLLFFQSCQVHYGLDQLTSVSVLIKDQKAQKLVKEERYEEALDLYIEMLQSEALLPELHSNIGVILNHVQKTDEALKSLKYALELAVKQNNPKAQFIINFNLGVYFGAKKEIETALKHYQDALNIVPTSIETKHNIELLTQRQNQKNNKNNKNDQQDQQKNEQQNQGQGQDNKDNKDQKENKNKQDNKDQKNDQDKKDDQPKEGQKQSSPKYKPRPYQGDQLSEGDVKKILGELKNQEQKIRANFDKKEKKDSKNEKDW